MQVSTLVSRAARGDGQRAEDVVAQALLHVRLDERDVLVGGGVVDRLHPVLAHYGAQQHVVEHRAEAGGYGQTRHLCQLVVHGVERELGVIEQHQLGRPLRSDLPAELAADRAAGAGDEHHLAGDVAGEERRVGRHRVAAEEVGHVDLADVGHVGLAVDQLVQPRQDLHRQAGSFHALNQASLLCRAGRGNGQHDLLDLVAEDRLAEAGRLVDGQAGNDLAVQIGAVVEEAHRRVIGADLHRLCQLRPSATGAVDCRAAAVTAGLLHTAAEQRAGDEARGDDVGEGYKPEHGQGRAWQRRDFHRPSDRQ